MKQTKNKLSVRIKSEPEESKETMNNTEVIISEFQNGLKLNLKINLTF